MSGGNQLRPQLEVTGELRAALANWDATNLSRMEECCSSFERAVVGLTKIRDSISAMDESSKAELLFHLGELRRESLLMAHLVDASAAFCRGLALTLGRAPDPENVHSSVVEA